MKPRTLCATIIALLVASAPAPAQPSWSGWGHYHGDAQRTGRTPLVLSTSPDIAWSVDLHGPVVVSPVLGSDGVIYVGTVQEDASTHPRAVLTAISPNGSVLWTFATRMVDHDLGNVSTPAIGPGDVVYFGAPDGAFYAVDRGGTLRWKVQGLNPVIQTPVVAPNGSVYAGMDGKLVKFGATGAKLWERVVGDPRQPGGPSLGLDGTVYVNGTKNGSGAVHAYTAGGILKWTHVGSSSFWPLAPPTVAPDGTVISVSDNVYGIRPDGTLKFTSQPTYAPNGYASVAVDSAGSIYLSAYVYIFKLDPAGNVVWEHLLQDGNRLGQSWGSIVVDGAGRLFTGLGTGKRWAIDLEKQLLILSPTGATIGSVTLPEIAGTSSPAIATNGWMYIGCLDGRLYALRP